MLKEENMALKIKLKSKIKPDKGKGKAKYKKPNDGKFKDIPPGGCEVSLNENEEIHLKVDKPVKPPCCNLNLGSKNNEEYAFNLGIEYEVSGSDKLWKIKHMPLQHSPGSADPTVNVTMGEDKSI
jgi:hypothetical protein